jgi:addiction module RelE/StbE family toxin
MEYKIDWTEPALAELRAIHEYIADRNEKAAERIIGDIVQQVELLRTVPLIGAQYPRKSPAGYREIVSGRYRIFYRVHTSARRVEVLTVWHSARQDRKLPE